MSLRASPAWSASAGTLSAIAPSASDHGADPVRPPDAPAGDQAADEPAEVQQRREQVPPERQHPDRVEDFAVRRVEPGEELRRDEVQVHVLPLWKNPAANGPWYQVLSNPVIPVESRVFTPPAKCNDTPPAATRNAPRDAAVAAGGSCREQTTCRRRCASRALPPQPPARHAVHRPTRRATDEQIRHGLEQRDRAEQLRDPDQEGQRQDGGGQARRRALEARQQARADPGRPQPGEADEQRQLGDAEQVAAGAEHLAAAAQQAQDLVELGDPQQLRDREVGDAAGAEAGAERDDLARPGRAPRALVEQVPDAAS